MDRFAPPARSEEKPACPCCGESAELEDHRGFWLCVPCIAWCEETDEGARWLRGMHRHAALLTAEELRELQAEAPEPDRLTDADLAQLAVEHSEDTALGLVVGL